MAATATMTGAQFDALPYEEGRRWELVGGELVEVSSTTPRHQRIVSRINTALELYFASRPGAVLMDVEFALTAEDRLRPDVLVLLEAKHAQLNLDAVPVPGAPDVAIEVISPSERASDIQEKTRRYLDNGTAEVWLIYPRTRQVELRRPDRSLWLSADAEIATDLLPDLRIPVTAIFEP